MNLQTIPLGYYAFSGLLNSVTCGFLGLFILSKDFRSELNRAFSAFCFAIAQWSLFYFLWLSAKEAQLADFYMRTCMIGVILMPSTFTHFVVIFVRIKKNSAFIFINYLVSLIIASTVYSSLWAKTGGSIGVFPYWLLPGKLFPAHLIHFFVVLVYSYFLILKTSKKTGSLFKQQVRYVFLGTLIGFLGGLTNYFYWYRVNFPPIFNVSASIGVPIITYGIIRYRLMDINIALTRAGIFIFVYTLVLGVPFWLGYTTKAWFPSTLLAVILASTGPFIYNYLRRQAEARLRAEDLKKYETLTKFASTMWRVRELDRLVKLIVYRLVKTLKIPYAGIYIFDDEEDSFSLKSYHTFEEFRQPPPKDISSDSDLVRFLQAWKKELLYEDLPLLTETTIPNEINYNNIDFDKVGESLRTIKASLIIPHFLEDHLIGFLVLGEKEKGKAYSEEDITSLMVLSRSASLAIMNAIFIMKLKETEWELAERQRVTQLGYLSSSTGHQINNILNNMVMIASNLLEDDRVRSHLETDQKSLTYFEKCINDIFESAEDAGMIISELKDYAKIQEDRKFTPVNLEEVLQKTQRLLSLHVGRFETVDIVTNIPEDLPCVLGSPVQLESVFVNMLNNAYDAIYEKRQYLKDHPELGIEDYKGNIEINIAWQKGEILIHIIDDGKGIPKDVQKRLFTPLYTTKGSQEKRDQKKLTGGTGIGLYTILVIIRNHRGSIKLNKTEFLKGTDFLITLPVIKK